MNYGQSEFAVAFEGNAFASKTMDVRDLAPALIALGQAFERANELINGNATSVSLNFRATRPGSVEVALSLDQLLQGASDVLSGNFFSSAAILLELVFGGSGLGLIGLIKKLRGRKPKKVIENGNDVVMEAENVRITVPKEVALLYADKFLRGSLGTSVEPLLREGVDRVSFRQDDKELEYVESNEAGYFDTRYVESDIDEYIIPRQRLQILRLGFPKDSKWQLSHGGAAQWYAMEDKDFKGEVERGKRFGSSDILICEVRVTQYIDAKGSPRVENAVQRVLRHIAPEEQSSFFSN